MVLAAEIPDGYLIAILPVCFVSLITLVCWIVKEMGKIQIVNAAMQVQVNLQHEAQNAQAQLLSAQAATLLAQTTALTSMDYRLRAVEAVA